MFIGREKELAVLNKRYKSDKFECILLYGRRRVGKTELIGEFAKDKRNITFMAKKGTFEENMKALTDAIYGNDDNAPFETLEKALAKINEMAKEEKLVFVIDEYPYFAESRESVSSILQHTIDKVFGKTNMMLILCDSSMSFMEKQVMGYQSPLYGRREGQIKLLPFDYKTSGLFTPNYTDEEKAIVFGVTGGIPKYLALFDEKLPLAENITNEFFDKNYYLFEEPENLLQQELRDPAPYNAVISAIALGGSQMKDIASKTGFETSKLTAYIKSLVDLGIIKREVPMFSKPESKKSIYRLSDGMFRFWYRFVYRNMSLINFGKGKHIYDNIKQEQLSSFMGEAFEQICIEYMWSEYENLPIKVQDIGRWWGNNPLEKKQEEIDLIAPDFTGKKAIFGECKWTNEKISESVVDDLIAKAKMFTFDEKYYYLFSKNGFTPACLEKVTDKIKLISYADMV